MSCKTPILLAIDQKQYKKLCIQMPPLCVCKKAPGENTRIPLINGGIQRALEGDFSGFYNRIARKLGEHSNLGENLPFFLSK